MKQWIVLISLLTLAACDAEKRNTKEPESFKQTYYAEQGTCHVKDVLR